MGWVYLIICLNIDQLCCDINVNVNICDIINLVMLVAYHDYEMGVTADTKAIYR